MFFNSHFVQGDQGNVVADPLALSDADAAEMANSEESPGSS